MISFEGRTAVITGAGGGIGGATARRFFSAGANLVLTDVSETSLEALAQELDASGTRVATTVHDARQPDDATAVAALARERFGSVDTLVTAAGYFPQVSVPEMTDEQWHEVIGINLDGVLYTARAMIPLMPAGASMIHIASLAGHRGTAEHAHYGAAKAGVLGLSRSLAHELAPKNIRVNAVSPGIIDTPMVNDLMRQRGDFILAATPLARLGTPDEVACAIVFLASDLASFITAETLHVNGGYYVGS